MFAIHRPFKINTEQLELLEPIERIEIEIINDIKAKKNDDIPGDNKKPEIVRKFTLLTDISNRIASNSKLLVEDAYLKEVVRVWMEIFLWFFECGYYDDADLQEVYRRVKETFKFFNEINIKKFVQWYAKFSLNFVKAALFRLQCKLIKDLLKAKGRFESKLSRFLGSEAKPEDFNLSFGNSGF